MPAGLARCPSTSRRIQPVTGSVCLWPGCDQCQQSGPQRLLIRPAACQETSDRRACSRSALPHPLWSPASLPLLLLWLRLMASDDIYGRKFRAGKFTFRPWPGIVLMAYYLFFHSENQVRARKQSRSEYSSHSEGQGYRRDEPNAAAGSARHGLN